MVSEPRFRVSHVCNFRAASFRSEFFLSLLELAMDLPALLLLFIVCCSLQLQSSCGRHVRGPGDRSLPVPLFFVAVCQAARQAFWIDPRSATPPRSRRYELPPASLLPGLGPWPSPGLPVSAAVSCSAGRPPDSGRPPDLLALVAALCSWLLQHAAAIGCDVRT
jgi:hypothetical protein